MKASLPDMRLKLFFLPLTIVLIFAVCSCVPQTSFGKLYVCSQINSETCQPVKLQQEYEIDTQKIYATIEVLNAHSADRWKFRWVDAQSGMLVAESSDRYLASSNQYVSGYFASLLVAEAKSNIIAAPGRYRVEYYHNQELVDSAEFRIKEPQLKILEATFASGVRQDGSPLDKRKQFFSGEDIYLCLRLNYLIGGNSLKATWFMGQDRLDEAIIELGDNHYQPSYQVLRLSNGVLPPGSYQVDIHINDTLDRSLEFEVRNDLTSKQVYQNPDYRFSLKHPDWLKVQESRTEDSYQITFSPKNFDANIVLGIWVVEADAAAGENNWSFFAHEVVLKDVEQKYSLQLEEKTEQGQVYSYRYKDANGDEWKLLLSFKNIGDDVYIFLGLADSYYADDMEQVYGSILNSMEFEIEK